jgi:hypothetical protein
MKKVLPAEFTLRSNISRSINIQLKHLFYLGRLLILSLALCLLATSQKAGATLYLSNLDNLWPSGSIGDIHGLSPGGTPYGNDTATFTTGAGNFTVNAITLQFFFFSGYPAGNAAPQSISIQLFQGDSLLGSFGNPVANPKPTQWPQGSNPNAYTQFIDFSPLQPITFSPSTEYSVVASMPASSSVSASLLFTKSSTYTSPADWIMGPTTTGNPYANGEYLMMAVNASPVPEPHATALLLIGAIILITGRRIRVG